MSVGEEIFLPVDETLCNDCQVDGYLNDAAYNKLDGIVAQNEIYSFECISQ